MLQHIIHPCHPAKSSPKTGHAVDKDHPMTTKVDKVDFVSLNNIAYEKIIDALKSGKFQPGDALITRNLAQAMGISSTPVREALSKLVALNALDVDPRNRSAMMPSLSIERLEELYSLREVLDGMAVEFAAQNITDAEIEEIQKLADELDKNEGDKEGELFLAKSEQFFLNIYRYARRPILFEVIKGVGLRSSVILGMLSQHSPPDFTISQHRRDLVNALADRNPQKARRAMNSIVYSTCSMVLAAAEKAAAANDTV